MNLSQISLALLVQVMSRHLLGGEPSEAVAQCLQVRPNKPAPLFVFTDPNKDPDDLIVFIALKPLEASGLLDLKAVVTTLGNRETRVARAGFIQAVLVELGYAPKPLAMGVDYDIRVMASDGQTIDEAATAKRMQDHNVFMECMLRSGRMINADATATVRMELQAVEDHSAIFLIIAGMPDTAALLRESPELLQRKLSKVVIMGGVEAELDDRGYVVADQRAYNNSTHQPSADYTYSRLQELGVPLVIVNKEAAYSTSVDRNFYEVLAATRHPVGVYLKNQQKQSLQNLWNGIIRGQLPPALTPEWFFQAFTDLDLESAAGTSAVQQAKLKPDDFDTIWNHVSKFNLYDPLALLATLPVASDLLFESRVPAGCKSNVQIIGMDSIKNPKLVRELILGLGMESLKTAHLVKSRTQIAKGYPARQAISEAEAPWSVPLANYSPSEYTAGVVFANEGKWADPRDVREVTRKFLTHSHNQELAVQLDKSGRPLNPLGRTGLQGRGLLGRWGRNQAGDPLLTRVAPDGARLQVLVIERKDSGQKALPGGMVDEGEDIASTVARELQEETGAVLDFHQATLVYAGVVDDPRNTDNAWMETTVLHKHLSHAEQSQLTLRAGDDAAAVHWVDITQELFQSMYASHADYVRMALEHLKADPAIAQLINELPER